MQQQLLKYPLKSHRKKVKFPNESVQLSELLGIIYGDGAIGNPWQVVISLNSIMDANYCIYLSELLENLFQIKVAVRKRPNQNTLLIVLSSINAVDYLVSKGAVRGNKISQHHLIPSWIKEKPEFARFFIRGLVDTDGCIYLHNHFVKGKKYVNIGLCLTNFSTELILSIDTVLRENNIKTHIADHGRRIYLYSQKEVEKYLRTFGSSNLRILNKYKQWRDARAV